METRRSVAFGPFRLELDREQLWREEVVLPLRPKSFAVLRYLVEHAGELVTKDALLNAVWAGTVVGDTVLKSCIGELRQALGDGVQSPQYIATVHRRGYRFIAPLGSLPGQPAGDVEGKLLPPRDKSPGGGRKLTAILSADVAGYSRLMGADGRARSAP